MIHTDYFDTSKPGGVSRNTREVEHAIMKVAAWLQEAHSRKMPIYRQSILRGMLTALNWVREAERSPLELEAMHAKLAELGEQILKIDMPLAKRARDSESVTKLYKRLWDFSGKSSAVGWCLNLPGKGTALQNLLDGFRPDMENK